MVESRHKRRRFSGPQRLTLVDCITLLLLFSPRKDTDRAAAAQRERSNRHEGGAVDGSLLRLSSAGHRSVQSSSLPLLLVLCLSVSVSLSSVARAGCKKTSSLLRHYPRKIKFIQSFSHSLSLCLSVSVSLCVSLSLSQTPRTGLRHPFLVPESHVRSLSLCLFPTVSLSVSLSLFLSVSVSLCVSLCLCLSLSSPLFPPPPPLFCFCLFVVSFLSLFC